MKVKIIFLLCCMIFSFTGCKTEAKFYFDKIPHPEFPNSVMMEGKGSMTTMAPGTNRSKFFYETDKSYEYVVKYYDDLLIVNDTIKKTDNTLWGTNHVTVSKGRKTLITIENTGY